MALKTVYHGSPKKYRLLKPSLDKRTGLFGLWVTDVKKHALLHAFIKGEASIHWSSKGKRFTGAQVRVRKPLFESGYLYTLKLKLSDMQRIKPHSYIVVLESIRPYRLKRVRRDVLDKSVKIEVSNN